MGINHARSGDLIAIADAQSWFTYYYGRDDQQAPDFARCVDIHRKSGYDPVELFVESDLALPRLKTAMTLLRRKLGFRTLMNVIPLDASLVKGWHARIPNPADYRLFITEDPNLKLAPVIDALEVHRQLKAAIG